MNYQQHRNHVTDGDYPWPSCPWCAQFVISPAIREMRNEYRYPNGVVLADELDERHADLGVIGIGE